HVSALVEGVDVERDRHIDRHALGLRGSSGGSAVARIRATRAWIFSTSPSRSASLSLEGSAPRTTTARPTDPRWARTPVRGAPPGGGEPGPAPPPAPPRGARAPSHPPRAEAAPPPPGRERGGPERDPEPGAGPAVARKRQPDASDRDQVRKPTAGRDHAEP